ncbi:MAG: YceI family protein [Bacteroidetes bacterium]|nr:YceI family protein [Bacteroidota bacterium]
MKQLSLSLLLLLAVTSIVPAQNKWKVDKTHTMINFTVSHMVISEVTGSFNEFDATLENTKDDFSDAKINVAIKAKSIDTGTEGRDNHLRSADFFNAAVDSIITFVSTKVEKTGADTYKIHGTLTMRGVSKEVILEAKNKGKIKGMRGMVTAFKASTTINRKDWGLNWNRSIEAGGLLVGENVDLSILVEFVEAKS